MWYNGNNSILPKEISGFTIEEDHHPKVKESVSILFESPRARMFGFESVNEIHAVKTG